MTQAVKRELLLADHVREIRTRLVRIVLFFGAACGLGYLFNKPLTHLILKPVHMDVYYTTPQGGLEFFMRVIMVIGFVGAVPAILYQVTRFIEPAFGAKLKAGYLRRLVFTSVALAAAGVAFGYLIILPETLHFFAGFTTSQLKPLISANDYLTMVLGILATFAVMFQVPLIINIIDKIKPITPQQLKRYRKHIIVGSLVIALVLPFTYDPITQFVVAAPVIVLYELSIVVLWINHREKRASKRARKLAATKRQSAPLINLAPAPIHNAVLVASQPAVDSVRLSPSHVLDLRALA